MNLSVGSMTPATHKRNREEIAKIGQEIFDRVVQPKLTPEDDGKYVAIDIATEEYEIDNIDWTVIKRLRARQQPARIWLVRVGKPVQMSFRMRFGQ